MTNGDTVGGQTLITGETVLVTPSGEVVGSTTPEIFRRGSRSRRRGRRGRRQTDAPADVISPIESTPVQAQARPSISQRFFSSVPTFGQQRGEIIREDISRFERLPEEERLEAAREGRFGSTFIPAGQTLRTGEQIEGFVTFGRRPSFGEQAGRTLRTEGISGLARRGAGSVFLGTSRTVLAGGQELTVKAITGGLPTQRTPDLEFAGSIRRQPGDPVQTGAAIGAIAIPVGFGALRFARVARAGGLRSAIGETTEAIAPIRIPSGTRFVPTGQLRGEDVFGFRRGDQLTGVGVARTGQVTRAFRADVSELAGGEELLAGTQFVRGTEVTVRRGVPSFREGIARVPSREIISPTGVEIPVREGVAFGGRGFVSDQFGALPLTRTDSRVFGVAGRRVRPTTEFAETGFRPQTRFVVSTIEPTFRGTAIRATGARRPSVGLAQQFAQPTALVPSPPRAFTITAPPSQQGLPLIGAGAFPQLLRQRSAFEGTGQFERTAGGLRPPRAIASTLQGRRTETAIPLGRGLATFGTTTLTAPRLGGIPAFRQPLAQAQPIAQRFRTPTPGAPDLLPAFEPFGFGFPPTPRFGFRRARFGAGGILPGFGIPSFPRLPVRGRQRQRRQPSFAALFFDIRAPEPAPLERTGLVLRPIIPL